MVLCIFWLVYSFSILQRSFIYIHIRVCSAGRELDCSVKWTPLGDVSLLHPRVFFLSFLPCVGAAAVHQAMSYYLFYHPSWWLQQHSVCMCVCMCLLVRSPTWKQRKRLCRLWKPKQFCLSDAILLEIIYSTLKQSSAQNSVLWVCICVLVKI